MPRCGTCRSIIVFGGVRDAGARYCSKDCYQHSRLLEQSFAIPDEVVHEALLDLHGGPCPRCRRTKPVDIHMAHTAYSFLWFTWAKSEPDISCRRCGAIRQVVRSVLTGLFGWWGPIGIVMTPLQLVRNLRGLWHPPDPSLPSTDLEKAVRIMLVRNWQSEVNRT